MHSATGFPYKVVIGLALIISMDTVVQLLWKIAAGPLPATPSFDTFEAVLLTIEAMLQQPLFLLVIGMMICQLIIWLMVLGEADLSFAQPFFSISRITVCLASAVFLGEQITTPKMLGIALVCAGAWCISRTPHNTGRLPS